MVLSILPQCMRSWPCHVVYRSSEEERTRGIMLRQLRGVKIRPSCNGIRSAITAAMLGNMEA